MQFIGLASRGPARPARVLGLEPRHQATPRAAAFEGRPLFDRSDRGGGAGFPAPCARELAVAHRSRRGRRRRSPGAPASPPSGLALGHDALGCSLVAIAILGLAAASSVGGSSSPDDVSDTTAGKARARALARFDDEEEEDEPSLGMVSIGAVIHALLTAKATLRRMASRGSKTKSQPPPVLNPAPSAPWSAVRDADDISTIAAALAPRARDRAPFPSFPPPVVSPLPARPIAVRAPLTCPPGRAANGSCPRSRC